MVETIEDLERGSDVDETGREGQPTGRTRGEVTGMAVLTVPVSTSVCSSMLPWMLEARRRRQAPLHRR